VEELVLVVLLALAVRWSLTGLVAVEVEVLVAGEDAVVVILERFSFDTTRT
jgi:hypothetical protein